MVTFVVHLLDCIHKEFQTQLQMRAPEAGDRADIHRSVTLPQWSRPWLQRWRLRRFMCSAPCAHSQQLCVQPRLAVPSPPKKSLANENSSRSRSSRPKMPYSQLSRSCGGGLTTATATNASHEAMSSQKKRTSGHLRHLRGDKRKLCQLNWLTSKSLQRTQFSV